MPILILVLLISMVGCTSVMPKTSNTIINLTITDMATVEEVCQSGKVYGCSFYYEDEPNVCYVYSVQDPCIVTHEIKHCTDGDWHKGRNSTACGWDSF